VTTQAHRHLDRHTETQHDGWHDKDRPDLRLLPSRKASRKASCISSPFKRPEGGWQRLHKQTSARRDHRSCISHLALPVPVPDLLASCSLATGPVLAMLCECSIRSRMRDGIHRARYPDSGGIRVVRKDAPCSRWPWPEGGFASACRRYTRRREKGRGRERKEGGNNAGAAEIITPGGSDLRQRGGETLIVCPEDIRWRETRLGMQCHAVQSCVVCFSKASPWPRALRMAGRSAAPRASPAHPVSG